MVVQIINLAISGLLVLLICWVIYIQNTRLKAKDDIIKGMRILKDYYNVDDFKKYQDFRGEIKEMEFSKEKDGLIDDISNEAGELFSQIMAEPTMFTAVSLYYTNYDNKNIEKDFPNSHEFISKALENIKRIIAAREKQKKNSDSK